MNLVETHAAQVEDEKQRIATQATYWEEVCGWNRLNGQSGAMSQTLAKCCPGSFIRCIGPHEPWMQSHN